MSSRLNRADPMGLAKTELAILNNICWYQAMFAAHGLASQTDGLVWCSHETPPPFHSNLVVRSPAATQADIERHAADIEQHPRPTGWSLKDSHACLDLSALGFSMLFQAEWIWREPSAPVVAPPGSRLSWARMTTPAHLAAWERAWSGDTRNETEDHHPTQFPISLLSSPDHAFFAGLLDGRIVAGGIANRSPGAVGLSNVFAPPEFLDETWAALVEALSAAFPGTPIVGYERNADLEAAKGAGFATAGSLRVWCRPTAATALN